MNAYNLKTAAELGVSNLECNILLDNHRKTADRWYGEEEIFLHEGIITVVNYALAVQDVEITEEQKTFVREILEEYSFLWPAIAEKMLELEPQVVEIGDLMKKFGNRLLLYSPGRVNSEVYDFLLGYEIMEGKNLLGSYFFGYRNWQLEFYDRVE